MKKITPLFICFFFLCASLAYAHPGRTNSQGCHTNRKTGDYHCHNSGGSSASSRSTNRSSGLSSKSGISGGQRLSGNSKSIPQNQSAALNGTPEAENVKLLKRYAARIGYVDACGVKTEAKVSQVRQWVGVEFGNEKDRMNKLFDSTRSNARAERLQRKSQSQCDVDIDVFQITMFPGD